MYRIHRVTKFTGLSRDVIRVWERRFEILKPTRTSNRYRNYSDEDVALMRFVKRPLDTGASIGELSKLGREELSILTPGIGGAALARQSSGSGHRAFRHEAHSIKNSLGHESGHL